MNNALLGLMETALAFVALLGLYRFLGKTGLFIWIPVAVILANVQVVKTIEIFGLTATLGNVLYATTFTATDMLSENHGRRDAVVGVLAGFIAVAATVLFMTLALLYRPAASDFAHESLVVIFSVMPRVLLGSIVAYIVSQIHDVWAYEFWKRRFPHPRFIFLRNNASTMVSQLLDTLIFATIAFGGLYEKAVFMQIILSTYAVKVIVAALDTPLIYLARYWKDRGVGSGIRNS